MKRFFKGMTFLFDYSTTFFLFIYNLKNLCETFF
jgi:hypothetical protein